MTSIDLFGLIGNDYIFYNQLMSRYYNKISQIQTQTNLSCNIIFNSIILKKSSNCFIRIENKCHSNQEVGLNLLLNTLYEMTPYMSKELRKKFEEKLEIDFLQPIETSSTKGFMKRCNAVSNVSNLIQIDKLNIQNCSSDLPLQFTFYNTGDARSNCGIVEILHAMSTGKIEEEETDIKKQNHVLDKVFGMKFEDLLIVCVIVSLCFIIIFLIYVFFLKGKKHLLSYTYWFSKNENPVWGSIKNHLLK